MARRILPWVVGFAFFITAVIAAWRIVSLREIVIEQERDQMRGFVDRSVANWEAVLIADLRDQLDALSADPSQAARRQLRLRKTRRWFDSVYVWSPQRNGVLVHHPSKPNTEPRDAILARPCIRRAAYYARQSPVDPLRVASAYILGCKRELPIVKAYAHGEAAYLYKTLGLHERGLEALEQLEVTTRGSVREWVRNERWPASRVAALRFARAKLLLEVGRNEDAVEALVRLGSEITELDAPDLGAPLHAFLRGDSGILGLLQRYGKVEQTRELRRRADRAERRLQASNEVYGQIMARELDPEAEPRFIQDQYADANPYLLYYGAPNAMGVALHLEQHALLQTFLNQPTMRPYRSQITITDAEGNWVAGARRGGTYAVTVPFSRTLRELRVHVRQTALDAAVSSTHEQWTVPFVIIALCGVLVMVALSAQVRLTYQEYELLNRQRAFTTRVTHELKTPLAGIRIMAENLELGAFKSDEQRAEMARRIVEEADRLKSRVDEVLSVARARTIPSPQPFDPEEAVLGAIDDWGPRLEDVGVKLKAESSPDRHRARRQ